MTERTLFLAWRDGADNCKWYPVGRLDTDVDRSRYRFRYTGGAKRAVSEVGFPLALDFPDLREDYRASQMFPLFKNRIIAHGRPDRADHLNHLDLPPNANPIEILSANGGRRVTDRYEVFPKLEKSADGSFVCRFFLHGTRDERSSLQERLAQLEPNERLQVSREPAHRTSQVSMRVQTTDDITIGWTPRYLFHGFTAAMAAPGEYKARVVRVNPQPAPSKQRVLVEMTGNWGSHEPMASSDFIPLVGD